MSYYKKVSICPHPLPKLIEAVNALPSDTSQMESQILEIIKNHSQENVREQIKGAVKNSKIFSYLVSEMSTHIFIGLVYQNFIDLLKGSALFKKIAKASASNSKIDLGDLRNTTFLVNGLTKIFQNPDTDFGRIRSCPICKRIFWAKQKTAVTCGQRKCVHRQKYLSKLIKEENSNGTL